MPHPPLRILILGSHGGLGRALTSHLAARHEVIPFTRAELDLTQLDHIAPRLRQEQFDVLVNPAGLTNPDRCVEQPEMAQLCNAAAPTRLAEICQERGAKMIHFSTDYVFDGHAKAIWTEEDMANPINHYGQTKLAGEQGVQAASPRALIARVSWLFGPHKASHPDHIIAKALQQAEISAVADKTACPTFTADIALWIETLLSEHRDVSGLLHLCNQGYASWQQWAQAALEIAQSLGVPVKTANVAPQSLASLTFFQAARPPHTALSTEKLTKLTGITPRSWRESLEDYLTHKFQGVDHTG
jgi:dTDP-4-dehydrorhamnose reductase